MAFRRGQCGFMYAALEALELPSSPPSSRNGLPSTTSCGVSPRFSRCGGVAAASEVASARKITNDSCFIGGCKIAEISRGHGRSNPANTSAGGTMTIEDAVGPVLAAAFLLGMLAEIIIPRETQPRLRFCGLIGIGFFVLGGVINVGLPLLLPGAWVATHSLLPGHRLGLAGGIAVGFVAWTFVYYWYHRSEHRFDLMWRALHQLHHSPTRVDAAGFAFAHPFDIITQTVISLVVMIGVLGLDTRAVALVGLYTAIAELVQHINVRTPRWLEWFMQRPEAHQRHHEFGQHAGNYADWPVWDKLFGTYRAPATAPLTYGFEDAATRRIGAMLACIDVNRAAAPIVRHE